MSRIISIFAIALFGASLSAQSFPHIEKDKVGKAIRESKTGNDSTSEKPDDTVPEVIKASDVIGDEVLAEYNKLLGRYVKDQKGQQAAFEELTGSFVDCLIEYADAQALLKLGYYDDAADLFKDIGYTVKGYDKLTKKVQIDLADEILSGKTYYYRIVASVMDRYKFFETEKELKSAWTKANKEASKILKDLNKAIKRKKIDSILGNKMASDIDEWLLTEQSKWRILWVAEKTCRAYPDKISSWKQLVLDTGSVRGVRLKEFTPAYLKQRAALEVIKKFWVTDVYVMTAKADEKLAYNYAGCLQMKVAKNALVEKSYHTRAGKLKLKNTRVIIKNLEKLFENLKK